jgi:argininosuccinate lyase
MSEVKQDTVTIDGKPYVISDLPVDVRNAIVARQEIQTSKVRHEVELEKIEVLTNHYNEKIKKGLEQLNGSESKSKD